MQHITQHITQHIPQMHRYQKIGVIGAGSMGRGIASLIACSGISVKLFDINQDFCMNAIQVQIKEWQALLDKKKMTDFDFNCGVKNLTSIACLDELSDVDLIIEAIIEDKAHKKSLFKLLEDICQPQTVFASNTSSFSITELSSILKNPKRMIGLHFFNPPTRMKLLELVTGMNTPDILVEDMCNLALFLKKIPVVTQSAPGFIVNRVARPFYSESMRILEETRTDDDFQDQTYTQLILDNALRKCGKFPMGAFELMDLIGHDVNFAVTHSVYHALYCDAKFTPSRIQEELVCAGFLGRKTGRGFYKYSLEGGIKFDGSKSKVSNMDMLEQQDLPKIHISKSNLLAQVYGDLGHAKGLIDRLKMADWVVNCHALPDDEDAYLNIAGIRMYWANGKTATQMSAEIDYPNIAMLDLAHDYAQGDTVALSFSVNLMTHKALMRNALIQLLAHAHVNVIVLPDVAGGVVMRTVAMLISIATDVLESGIANKSDIDLAMKYGTNHPLGPFEWAELIGFQQVHRVLRNLHDYYGDARYRQSRYLIQRSFV